MASTISGKYEGPTSSDCRIIDFILVPFPVSPVKTHDPPELHQTQISCQACSLLSYKACIFRSNQRRVHAKTGALRTNTFCNPQRNPANKSTIHWTIYKGEICDMHSSLRPTSRVLRGDPEILHEKPYTHNPRFTIMSFIHSKAATTFDLPTPNCSLPQETSASLLRWPSGWRKDNLPLPIYDVESLKSDIPFLHPWPGKSAKMGRLSHKLCERPPSAYPHNHPWARNRQNGGVQYKEQAEL